MRKMVNIFKLQNPLVKCVLTPQLNTLSEVFKKNGHELRMVGGVVRDLLLNKPPHDVDFATTATPAEMHAMFNVGEFKLLKRKGEGHGTVTVSVEKEAFEITTLRVDVATDGRHAEVSFTKDWALDAARRDLTVNAMFLDMDSNVYDFHNGKEHLDQGEVLFIGDPDKRLSEDYLRILRYFRFFGKVSPEPDKFDPEIISAVTRHADGLAKLSGQKKWLELKKILFVNHAESILRKMSELNLNRHLGLPGDLNFTEFQRVISRSSDFQPSSITVLVSLLHTEAEVLETSEYLKFAKLEKELGLFLVANRNNKGLNLKQIVLDAKENADKYHFMACEWLKYRGDEKNLKEFVAWTVPKFPINGHMLKQRGITSPAKIKSVLSKLRARWVESEYTLTEAELLVALTEMTS